MRDHSMCGPCAGIPRLYAAASLKHVRRCPWYRPSRISCIPRLYAAASLKPVSNASLIRTGFDDRAYSAALCRGLIEAYARRRPTRSRLRRHGVRIPRLYAAASLKLRVLHATSTITASGASYSAALCRGLIEAGMPNVIATSLRYLVRSIPRLYAAASLKHYAQG